MITGAIKSQVDKVWDAFWSGGISNPLEVIEQITYLLFLRRLDDLQTLEENKATRLKKPMERRIFPEGKDELGRPYEDLRWSRFKNFAPDEMFTVVDRARLPVPAHARWRRLDLRAPHEGRPLHHPHARSCSRRSSTSSTRCRWRTATPRATSTSTCSARSPPPDRTASSARRATSSSSWWR